MYFDLEQVKMQRALEQRFTNKFCVKLTKTAMEIVTVIKTTYKEHAMSDQRFALWESKKFSTTKNATATADYESCNHYEPEISRGSP